MIQLLISIPHTHAEYSLPSRSDELKYICQVLGKGELSLQTEAVCSIYETGKIHGLRFAGLLNSLYCDGRNHLKNFSVYGDMALPRGNLFLLLLSRDEQQSHPLPP